MIMGGSVVPRRRAPSGSRSSVHTLYPNLLVASPKVRTEFLDPLGAVSLDERQEGSLGNVELERNTRGA